MVRWLGCSSKVYGTYYVLTRNSITARHSSSECQPNFVVLNSGRHLYSAGRPSRWALAHIKVRTDSSTEFVWNPILIDQIQIELAAGSNPILIVLIHTALDHAVNFNERITAFTRGRACTPVCWVATSKAAMPTYSWDAGLRIISAQLHCILCNTITQHDSDSSWRWKELMLCVMWVGSQRLSTPPFDSQGKL